MSGKTIYYCDLCTLPCGDSEDDEPEHFVVRDGELIHTMEKYGDTHVCYFCFATLKTVLDG